MATAEERQKILEMVAAGKISAAEAAALLNPSGTEKETQPENATEPAAVEASEVAVEEPVEKDLGAVEVPVQKEEMPPGSRPSWLRIRVDDATSGRRKVSVNIPLRLMKVGLQLGSNFAPELRSVDWDRLSTSLAEGEGGLLLEVQDEEDGEHVRIFVE